MSITALDPMLEDALLTRSKIDEAIRPIQAALDSPTIRAINAALAFKPPAMSLIESAISPELISKLSVLENAASAGMGLDIATLSGAIEPIDLGIFDVPAMQYKNLLETSKVSLVEPFFVQTGLDKVQAMLAESAKVANLFAATVMPAAITDLFSLQYANLLRIVEPVLPSFDIFDDLARLAALDIVEIEETSSPLTTDAVAEWLGLVRVDLKRKYEGMWQALVVSVDPVLHASTSAVELLLHLCGVCGASDEEVLVWASSNPAVASEAVDMSSGYPRVTWAGRARLIAIRAGYDEVGQEFVLSLARSGSSLQRIKHHAHRYEVTAIEEHLQRVDELVTMLAWRIHSI